MFSITVERPLPASDAAYPGETFFVHIDYATDQDARKDFANYVYNAIVGMRPDIVSVLLKDGLNVLAETSFYVDDQEEDGE